MRGVEAPARRQAKVLRARVLKMEIDPRRGVVNLLLRLDRTGLADRNALHHAMKQGIDLGLAYFGAEDEPIIEGGEP